MPNEKVILELQSPGTWLILSDESEAFRVGGFLRSTISSFYEANAALWLFEDALEAMWLSVRSKGDQAQWEAESNRRREIQDQLEQSHGYSHQLYEHADLLFKREQWQQGKLPREFENAFPSLHAHGFLFAIDAIGKFLGVLASHEAVPSQAQDAAKRFDDELPQVREIRNSAQHKEDRIRGLGPRNRPIPRQPVEAFGISAPDGGIMVMSGLHNSTLTYTTADGHLLGFDITLDTLLKVQDILQGVLNAFAWKGRPDHHPS